MALRAVRPAGQVSLWLGEDSVLPTGVFVGSGSRCWLASALQAAQQVT